MTSSLTPTLAGFSTAGVPGFAAPDPGTFATYRAISSHPTVALAMRIVTAPVIANAWGWRSTNAAPAEAVEFARSNIDPMRVAMQTHGMAALVFGFAAFEKVWAIDGGHIKLQTLKPLLPEMTSVLLDSSGDYWGLQNKVAGQPPRDLPASKCFLYTYDGECGNAYGRSRHENIRATWSMAQQTATRLAQYQKKVAGVIAQLHYPEGMSRDAAGVERGNDLIAQEILEAVSMGKSVRFPNLFASVEDPTAAAALAGKSQWVLSQFDPGGSDYSGGLLNALGYYDKLLFRGWLRPERVGLEAAHGTRADAMEHSETAIVDSELIAQDFAASLNRQVVDDLLEQNYGQSARGTVWIEPSPISDTRNDNARALLTTLLAHPTAASAVVNQIDIPALLDDLDMPRVV